MADIIQIRRDTSTNWTSVNPILASGEMGFETNTRKFKFGDAVTRWNVLPYALDTANQETFSGVATVNFGSTLTDEATLVITGLGSYTWETYTTALNIDGIICSYQVPVGTTAIQGRRLKINGVSVSSVVQTVLAGGPQNVFFYLAFGGTTVSLQATESGFVKLSRRYRLPFVQTITAAQAVNTPIAQNMYDYKFVNPIYVNPGEWIQVVKHAIGTVGTSGTIAHIVTFDYSWE
jgi:hypothetical protein